MLANKEYKDSGIVWLGHIPAHWGVDKIGSVYTERRTIVSDEEYEPLSVTKTGIVPQLDNAAKSDAHDNRKLVVAGDFVINSRSDRKGSSGISNLDGSVSLINTVLEPRANMNNKYYNFVFKTDMFCDEFYKWGHGIVADLWTTRWTDMKNIYVPRPDLSEQKAIATYLDKECARIDGIVATQRQIIERLKEYKKSVITEAITRGLNPDVPMKDSGIEWIGRIPASWEAQRIKSAFDFFKGLPITKENLKESGLAVLSYGQVHAKNNDFVSIKEHLLRFVDEDYKKYSQSKVNKFDFVFADTSEDLDGCGNCCYKRDDSELYAGYHTLVLRSKHKKDNRFFAYLFTTDIWRQQIRTKVSGVKLFSVTQRILSQTSIIIPSDKEQKEIADYLDRKCSEIDSIIEKRERMIELMTEYKKSLIYECVTGKKEIVDVVE